MMNRADFISKVLEPSFKSIMQLNATKGHDYAGDEDALSNFKEVAKRKGLTPEQVLGVYLDKHLCSIDTYIREGQVESEPIEGRIDDAILYLLLLKGLVHEYLDPEAAVSDYVNHITRNRPMPRPPQSHPQA